MVTNEQLYIALGIPMLFNAALIGFVIAYINARFDKQDGRFEIIERRLDGIDKRFDDRCGLWCAELRRVKEVLDGRLKHLEERGS